MYSTDTAKNVEMLGSMGPKMYSGFTVDCCSQIVQQLFHFVQLLSRNLEKAGKDTKTLIPALFCPSSEMGCRIQLLSKILRIQLTLKNIQLLNRTLHLVAQKA